MYYSYVLYIAIAMYVHVNMHEFVLDYSEWVRWFCHKGGEEKRLICFCGDMMIMGLSFWILMLIRGPEAPGRPRP